MIATPHIAVFIMDAYRTQGDTLRGILSYTRTHSEWALDLKTGRRDEKNLEDIDWSSYDGAIVNGITPALLRQIRRRKIPATLISPDPVPNFPGSVLTCDNTPIAITAAKHLTSKHCKSYAFVHSAGQKWSDKRGHIFAEAIEAAGGRFIWRASETKTLVRLIGEAPKPLGIFAATDILAHATLDACRAAGCLVPDDVLILGVDNDITLCEMSTPTLSSIPLTSYDAGYHAAEVLDRAIRGDCTPEDMPDVFFTGGPVVERLSTAHSFAYDMLVRRCRETLESEFASPIRVSELAKRFRVSRRTLETHFRSVTGTTIAEEVIRLRIEHAKHLLSTTTRPIDQIATECGFHDASHLSSTFLGKTGSRPSSFRRAR